jgi:site-specific recombinase XerD
MSVLHYVGLFQTYKLKLSMEQKHKVTLRHQKMHEQNNDENTEVTFLPAERTFEVLSAEAAGTGVNGIEKNPAVSYLMGLRAESSRLAMRSFLNNIAKMMGYHDLRTCPWGMLERHHVQAVLTMLTDAGKAPATINNYLAAIKGVAVEAWTLKLISTDTYQHIKLVKSVRGSRIPKGRALAPAEVKKLFFTCESDKSAIGVRDNAILSVLVGCGLRRAEVVSLDFAHYNRHNRSLKVLGKGNKERMAYLPDGAFQRLESWVEEIRSDIPGPLFSRVRRYDDVTSERMTSQAIYHILNSRSVEAGIEKCAPHDLRRTFASSMLENGEDLITVKDAMGHASLATTQKYDFRGDERLRAASKRLDI